MNRSIKKFIYEHFISKRYLTKFRYVINMAIGIIYAHIISSPPNIWLIGNSFDGFENNTSAMYLYLEPILKDNLYWICDKKNMKRLKESGVTNLIIRGSVKNYYLAYHAQVGLYSYSDSDIAPRIYRWLKRKTLLANLTHGYTGIKRLDTNYYGGMPADIICSPSKFDWNCNTKYCSAEKSKMFITGLARYDFFPTDGLKNGIQSILCMPTWRDWYYDGSYNFKNSDVFCYYEQLLYDIQKYSKHNNLNLHITLILHPSFCKYYSNKFGDLWKEITIITDMGKIKDELIKNDLLITDYSSVTWDYIYMNKPVIFYWFDYEEYNTKRGIYDEFTSMIKKYICKNSIDVIDILDKYIMKNEVFISREEFYEYIDQNNRERIYFLINDLLKNKRSQK